MWRTSRVAIAALLLLFTAHTSAAPFMAAVRVVDVGHGLCTYTSIPTGLRTGNVDTDTFLMVYDAGPGTACTESLKSAYGYALHEIDLLIISHNAPEHFGGAIYLLRDFQVNEVWHSGRDADSPVWRTFKTELQRAVNQGTVLRTMTERAISAGERRFITPETYLSAVFGPGRWEWGGLGERDKDAALSIAVRLSAGDNHVLYTADMLGRNASDTPNACRHSERLMVSQASAAPLRSTILLAPNHGHHRSSATCFINAVDPLYVVISAGSDDLDTMGDAIARYQQAGVPAANIFRTNFGAAPGESVKSIDQSQCRDNAGDDDVQIYLYLDKPPLIGYATTNKHSC